MTDERSIPPTSAVVDMEPGDQDAVRELILAGLAEHWGSIDAGLNRDLDDLLGHYAAGRTVVVRDATGIVATGTVVPRDRSTAEVVRMSVRHDRRAGGLGRAVLDELVATARWWGADRVVLETTSAWRDVVAFYLRCGFRVSHTAESPFGEDTWFELEL